MTSVALHAQHPVALEDASLVDHLDLVVAQGTLGEPALVAPPAQHRRLDESWLLGLLRVRRVACLEEIAYRNGFISREKLEEIGATMSKNDYGRYLLQMAKEDRE